MTDYQALENKARQLSAQTQHEMVRHVGRAIGRMFGAGRAR